MPSRNFTCGLQLYQLTKISKKKHSVQLFAREHGKMKTKGRNNVNCLQLSIHTSTTEFITTAAKFITTVYNYNY